MTSNVTHTHTHSPLHSAVVCGTLGPPHSVDVAVHHPNTNPVPWRVGRGVLAPLVGHGVVAAKSARLSVVLQGQVPAPHLENTQDPTLLRLCANTSLGVGPSQSLSFQPTV